VRLPLNHPRQGLGWLRFAVFNVSIVLQFVSNLHQEIHHVYPNSFSSFAFQKTPVQLMPSANGFKILTEPEWQQGKEPAFEIRSRQGFFCQGVLVVGYNLEPIAVAASPTSTTETSAQGSVETSPLMPKSR
jgi:hypothetical protein